VTLLVFAKNLAGERVHKVDLLTHDTGHGLIRILVLRNPFGGESVNTEPRVWAAVDKGGTGHCTNNAIRTVGGFDLRQSIHESDDLFFG
jgi:hypothetical protein